MANLMMIDGRSVESSDGRYIDIENPANRTTIAETPRASKADVDFAVLQAAAAGHIVENREVQRVVQQARPPRQYEFHMTFAPLPVEGGTGRR